MKAHALACPALGGHLQRVLPLARIAEAFGGLAEFERELIRAKTGEGRKRAKDRGVKFGRPRKMTPHQRLEALQRLSTGETMADTARTYALDPATISRLAASSPFEHCTVGL
jgi:DNA invertase Pin-like site-specific DNA recombinase